MENDIDANANQFWEIASLSKLFATHIFMSLLYERQRFEHVYGVAIANLQLDNDIKAIAPTHQNLPFVYRLRSNADPEQLDINRGWPQDVLDQVGVLYWLRASLDFYSFFCFFVFLVLRVQ